MKRTAKYALSAVIVAAIAAPAFAQDNFPDTPANHWAYEAVARLKKDGILSGYPDGLFRGSRPATRFELAAAVHAAYLKLKVSSDGLNSQIDTLKQKMDQGGVTKADLDKPGLEGAKWMCSPPPRETADQDALWQALALGEVLGQTIVVENVGAAAGTVGSDVFDQIGRAHV